MVLLAGLLLVCALAGAGRTALASTVVVLVRPPKTSALTTEATVRLRGELVAAGFEVRVIDPPFSGDIRASLELAASGADVEAVVAILGDASGEPSQDSAELWVIDRVTGKTVVRRVPNAPGSARAAEVLSIRALELLRASFLEVALAGRAPKIVPDPPPAEVARFADNALVEAMDIRARSGWAVEVGGCILGSLEGLTPSLVPIARLQHSFGDHFVGRVTFAGLGTQSHLTWAEGTAGGTADVSQQFGLVEGAVRFRGDRTLQPFVSVGVGALHITAAGQVSPGQVSPVYMNATHSRFTLVIDAGAGIRLPLNGRFELGLEIHAQAARPYPVIGVPNTNKNIATEGRPTLISSLSVIAWL